MVDVHENSLRDLPAYDGLEDEAFPPLPPPQSPGRGGREDGDPFGDGEDAGDVSQLTEVPAAKRRAVKRPQPKLDSSRLISDRGLPSLRTLFHSVHFKGKGHEVEDLQLLMQRMENWAHRLFPKLQFEDFIDKVEKLGTKKEVQTCLKRIRLDMPLTHEDFTGKEGDHETAPGSHIFGDPEPLRGASFPDDLQRPISSTPAPAAPPVPPPQSLTEEQRHRMELNRQQALERRLARQQQPDPSGPQSANTPLSADEASSSFTTTNCRHQQDSDLEPSNSSSPPHATDQGPSQTPGQGGREESSD
ncbi:TIMELESS-interacting protein [Aulostomus maculatus]